MEEKIARFWRFFGQFMVKCVSFAFLKEATGPKSRTLKNSVFLSAKHLYVSKFPHARAHERPLYSNFKTVRSEQLNAMITQNLLLAQFFL